MQLTDLQLFKGYLRYIIEEHISTAIFAAKEGDPLCNESGMRVLWQAIQPWNRSEKDLWDCFVTFDEWKQGKTGGTDLELFKEYIRHIAEYYLDDFFDRAREADFRQSNRSLQDVLGKIEPWRRGECDLWECFDDFEPFKQQYTGYLQEEHFGDCNGMATTCARCLAEDYFKD